MAASAVVLPFPASAPAGTREPDGPARSLSKLKKAFTNATGSKFAENREAAEAERYFHSVQWTSEQLKELKARNQPPVTFNRVKRKINTICGIIEKLRQDPKAYPRNPQRQSEDGAELATKVINYAIGWDWQEKSTTVARRTSIRGLSGVELVIVEGDQGDPDLEWDKVDQRDFFYDPKSSKHDFSDARFMGTTKWVDVDDAAEKFPDYAEHLRDYVERNPTTEYDRGDERRTMVWYNVDRDEIRLVEHWYMVGSRWHYAIYCGDTILEYGPTYLKDHKGRDCHKYEMLSYEIDQDNDRYGAVRDLKSAQDEINQRRSKALHQLHSRKVIADAGAVDDVETARREYARADGWVVKNPGREIVTEDAQAQAVVQGNMELLAEAKAEIDTYGPNPGLIGTDIPADSGRAIQLLQAAGISELGSFVTAYKAWKLRVYRKTWCAVQQFWTAPRWIRVTDDENLSQFVEVNGWQKDPATGMVSVINQLAALDVDIILDEGADSVNTMADTFDTLLAMAKTGAQIPPEMIIEFSPVPSSTKQRILQQISAAQQQNPLQQAGMQLQLQLLGAQVQELATRALKNQAQSEQALADAQQTKVETMRGPEPGQIDTPADMAKADLDVARAQEIRHKIDVGAHVPQAAAPQLQEPGLFELNAARTRREDAQAAKTLLEASTIAEAPPGMLTTPPPRPPVTPGRKTT